LRERIIHFVDRQAMDIEGLGPKRVQQLMQANLLPELPALYRLKKDDLIGLDRYAEKSAENLLQEIEESKHQPLDRFLYALGIPLVGLHLTRVLTRHFETLDDIRQASQNDLQAIDEIGPEIARSIAAFFSENSEGVDALLNAGIELNNPRYAGTQDDLSLQGETFVFTGELEHWSRDEARQLVEQKGARATSSVSGNTDYVVVGVNPGSKLKEAKKRKIRILNERQFRNHLKQRT
jgi:DNA ligase (NAD+)